MFQTDDPSELTGHSVTLLLDQLKQRDPDAARKIWRRYFERLIPLARAKLPSTSRHQDEEDILVSVFDRFFRAVEEERFQKLDDREDLWSVLVLLTDRKVADEYRNANAQKRGSGKVKNVSSLTQLDASCVREIAEMNPSPEYLVSFNETLARALQRLDSGSTREVAILRMEGYQNREIAVKLGIGISSVERKLRVIREVWRNEFSQSDE